MNTYPSIDAALADPESNISRNMRDARTVMADNKAVIAQWMALGYTRDEAYQAALFGYRK